MEHGPRWPTVIGTIGIVLGIILLIDTVDDVMMLRWTAEDWRRIFGPDLADVIARSLPPLAWRVASAAVQVGLAALLIVGSVALRRHARNGVSLCRLWAWLAIGWAVVSIGRGGLWVQQHAGELPAIVSGSGQAYVLFGLALAVVLLSAFPVFLLVWLAKSTVRVEYETWSG